MLSLYISVDRIDLFVLLARCSYVFCVFSLNRYQTGVEERKKQERMEETMMIDQLSRAVISDPSQDSGRSGGDVADRLYHKPGESRGAIRRLHNSRYAITIMTGMLS